MLLDRRSFLKLFSTTLFSLSFEFPTTAAFSSGRPRVREAGIRIGLLESGRWNAITDVPGVRVGHTTLIRGSGPLIVGQGPVRTGVTVIWPHDLIYDQYVPAGFCVINGNGEVTGLGSIGSFGVLGFPIALTNTSSVGMVYDSLLSYFSMTRSSRLQPVIGETWDAFLNDIEGRHVALPHVYEALQKASSGPVPEGNVGGGTGMICYQFKGGIGTSSRKLPEPLQKYTVGVLVQANHGTRENLRIDGVPVGQEITDLKPEPEEASYLSSIIIVIATDAPLLDYQLDRIARRAVMGLAKTGSIAGNSSGDFALAFSTANRIPAKDFWQGKTYSMQSIEQNFMTPLFQAVSDATEEAILNALFQAEDMEGRDGHKVYALPIPRVLQIMERYHRIFRKKEDKKIASL